MTAVPQARSDGAAPRLRPAAFGGAAGGSRLVAFADLAGDEIEAWHRLRSGNPMLDSPFFDPAFAAAVDACGPAVSVVVARDAEGTVTALLPGHRRGGRFDPVGWPGADFQAPIAATDGPAAPLDLLPRGIREARFDHLLSAGPQFDPYIVSRHASPYLDTTGGLDGYLGRASRTGKENMGQARRRLAKAERELGPVRFAADVLDDAALETVIRLKRGQYAATGAPDYFAEPSRVALMSRLLYTREVDCAGILSTLHIGGNLVAAHFGIRSGSVLHWWFPVYDPAFGHLAPGWILLRELVLAAPALGVDRIDLGRGDDEYKRRAKTGEAVVCQATLTRSATLRMARRARYQTVELVRSSPLGPRLRSVVKWIRGARGGHAEEGNA